jgi:hypothetical protein
VVSTALWLLGTGSYTGLETVAVAVMVAPAAGTTLRFQASRRPPFSLPPVQTIAAAVPVPLLLYPGGLLEHQGED